MSKHRKAQRPASGGKPALKSKFPVVPVIALAMGVGLYLTFSGGSGRVPKTSSSTQVPPAVPPPPAVAVTPPSTNATAGGTTLADLIPTELEMTDEERADEFLNRGTELYQQGNFTEAATNYATAVTLNPSDEAAHFNLGSALVKLGRIPEADFSRPSMCSICSPTATAMVSDSL